MSLARFAAAAVAASAIAGSTLAADLVPPQYLAPTPVFSWTGFNIGIDGGFGGGVIDANTILFQPPIIIGGVTFSPGSVSTLHTSNRTVGFIVGGQVGYNYQLPNNIVVGIESDAQWSNVKESEHETAASTNPTLRFTDLRAGLDWFGTTRLRLGYARGRFLPYITGGVSYGQVSGSQRVSGAPGTVFGSASSTHAGWTAGAGAEYALTAYISLKAEYLFVQLNGVSGSEVGFAPPVVGSFKIGTFGANIVRPG